MKYSEIILEGNSHSSFNYFLLILLPCRILIQGLKLSNLHWYECLFFFFSCHVLIVFLHAYCSSPFAYNRTNQSSCGNTKDKFTMSPSFFPPLISIFWILFSIFFTTKIAFRMEFIALDLS